MIGYIMIASRQTLYSITFKITLKKELTEMNDRAGGGHKMTINFPFISWRINSQTIQSIFGIQEIQPLFKFVYLICKMEWILKRNQSQTCISRSLVHLRINKSNYNLHYFATRLFSYKRLRKTEFSSRVLVFILWIWC